MMSEQSQRTAETDRACPVCARCAAVELFRPKASPGPVARCRHCSMVYVSSVSSAEALIFDGPVLDPSFSADVVTSTNLDDVAGSWEFGMLEYKLNELPALRRNGRDALAILERHRTTDGKKLLDFGSGWGFFLSTAQAIGWEAVGLEPLPASSIYARANFGVEVVTDTLRETTFSAETFDAITSFQVFEHLPNPKRNLRILHSALRTNGLLLIEVPNFDTWLMRLMKARHRHFVADHLNFFTANTLRRLLQETGFTVVEHIYPTRRMSVRHLTTVWVPRFVPHPLSRLLTNTLQNTRVWEQTLGVNVGDILMVVARKT